MLYSFSTLYKIPLPCHRKRLSFSKSWAIICPLSVFNVTAKIALGIATGTPPCTYTNRKEQSPCDSDPQQQTKSASPKWELRTTRYPELATSLANHFAASSTRTCLPDNCSQSSQILLKIPSPKGKKLSPDLELSSLLRASTILSQSSHIQVLGERLYNRFN